MNGQIITVALILLGHIFLTPAVQAIGFDYYNDHGVMSYGKGYGEDEKIIAQFPKMNRADLRLVTNISGERELVEGYIPVSYTHLDVYKRQVTAPGKSLRKR